MVVIAIAFIVSVCLNSGGGGSRNSRFNASKKLGEITRALGFNLENPSTTVKKLLELQEQKEKLFEQIASGDVEPEEAISKIQSIVRKLQAYDGSKSNSYRILANELIIMHKLCKAQVGLNEAPEGTERELQEAGLKAIVAMARLFTNDNLGRNFSNRYLNEAQSSLDKAVKLAEGKPDNSVRQLYKEAEAGFFKLRVMIVSHIAKVIPSYLKTLTGILVEHQAHLKNELEQKQKELGPSSPSENTEVSEAKSNYQKQIASIKDDLGFKPEKANGNNVASNNKSTNTGNFIQQQKELRQQIRSEGFKNSEVKKIDDIKEVGFAFKH